MAIWRWATEYLHISLCHLHADIVLRLLQIGRSSLEVQLVQLDLVGNLETREQWHAGTQLQRGAAGIGVGIGVLSRQTTTEREVLTYRTTQVRQTGVTGGRELYLSLATLVLLLLDADIMRYGIVTALAKRPLLRLS